MRRRRTPEASVGTKESRSTPLGTNPGHEYRLRLTDEDRALLVELLDHALPYLDGDPRWQQLKYDRLQLLRPLRLLRRRLAHPIAGTNRRRRQ